MALMKITVLPLGTKSSSIGDYIADIIRLLDKEDTAYTLTDMGTIIEGDAAELFELAARLHMQPFKKGISRVVTTVEIDDRRDKEVHLKDKITSVRARLGH